MENNFQHKTLASGLWAKLSFFEQMANIGSEVERAISWRKKGNFEYGRLAAERALELLDLTVDNYKAHAKLSELLRLREALVDYLYFNNTFSSSDELWQGYFRPFNFAARINC